MRVGIDIRAIGKHGTGDEVYTSELIRNLAQMKSADTYILFTDDERVTALPEIRNLPDTMHVVVIPPAHRALWMFVRLPRYVKYYQIDVLHVQYITPLSLPKNVGLVTTVHDISWRIVPEYIPRKDRILLNRFIPIAVRKADAVITVSEHSQKQILNRYPASEGNVYAVHNGGYIPPEERAAGAEPECVSDEALDRGMILHISSLQPRKNVPLLLRAHAKLCERYTRSRPPMLVIAGGGGVNYDAAIDSVIAEYGLENDVLKTGRVSQEEKYWLYAHARVFVSLSAFEGFGIPFIEAMSFQTPVLGSDASCLPEIIGEAGETAATDRPDHIAERLRALCEDESLRARYGERGAQRARMFTWRSTAEHTHEIYHNVKKNKTPRNSGETIRP